jgi:glutamate racemase
VNEMSHNPIAVFDSGLGGLTVAAELARLMPAETLIYLGDSARVPYGTKSLATVRRFALENAAFCRKFDPKLIVVACNTASAAAMDELEASNHVPVLDVIRPAVATALAATDGPIGVIATEATVTSGVYDRLVTQAGCDVLTQSCPLLVPIIEEGRPQDDPIVLSVLSDYLHELQRRRVGALILGCTHYPLLSEAIGKLMGPDVALINSGQAAARAAADLLRRDGLDRQSQRPGLLRCFTTGDPARFATLGTRFVGHVIDRVDAVDTDDLKAALA